MIVVEIAKVPEDGYQLAGEEPGSLLELDDDVTVGVVAPLRYDLFVQLASDELVVTGEVAVDLERVCTRCGEFFSTTDADSSFLRAYDIAESTESVDLTDDVREAVLLLMPLFPLCEPDCAGLCAQCGQNLNKGSCDCRPQTTDARWEVLDGLASGDSKDVTSAD